MISKQGLFRYGSLALLFTTLSGCIVLPYGGGHHRRGGHHIGPTSQVVPIMVPVPHERHPDRRVR